MAQILIIDDSKAMRDLLREMLQDAGHQVLSAENGLEGLRQQRKEPADLAIVDIFMPEKDGMSTIRDLRREYPRLAILAISGGDADLTAPDSFLNLAKRFGADEALPKPFLAGQLTELVARLLQRS
ncbi:MAG: response regulator [Candidatus Hydrogenedentes bacterium]|nr:response regulator [Candidatus Hydrogenedentota bacterium]